MNQKIMCHVHNMPIIYIGKGIDNDQQLLCTLCIQMKLNVQAIDDFLGDQNNEYSLNLLQELLEALINFKQQFLHSFDQFLSTIINSKTLFEQIRENNIDEAKEQRKDIMNIIHEVKKQLNQDLTSLQNASKTDKFFNILKKYEVKIDIQNVKYNQVKQNYQDKPSSLQIKQLEKKLDYQLLQQSLYKQNELCYAIAFNKDSSIIIAGCAKLIQVFEFKQEKLEKIQELNGHSYYVYCLLFMNNSNQFISGSYEDGIIMIWEQCQNHQWSCIQVLKAHKNNICCIILNQKEDIMVSGSVDKCINFSERKNNTWSIKQSINCSSQVWSISLNNLEDTVIASLENNSIIILKLEMKSWMIVQTILLNQHGKRISFYQDKIVFQPFDRQYLLVYDFNNEEKKYKLSEKVVYQNKGIDDCCLFPIQNNSQMGLIVVKNDEYIHLITRQQQGFKVEQSIHFGTYQIFGSLSKDGKYIATWDQKSKEIQLRKLNY